MSNLEQLDAVTTGKALRATLKAAFPGTKFSVRMDRGTAYGSYSVSWTDGPTSREADVVLDQFAGKGFDGMTDSTTFTRNVITYKGTEFTTGAGYVSGQRSHSDELKAEAAAKLNAKGWAGGIDWACAVRMVAEGHDVDQSAATHHCQRRLRLVD